jgi:hypothetical protein
MTVVAALRDSEKDVQRKVYKLLAQCGCAIYNMSQVRASMVSLGIPDLMCFHALRGFAFIEVKAENGRMSTAQREFQHQCSEAGITYIVGGVQEVRDWLGAKR